LKKLPTWIVLKGNIPPQFKCERCGDTRPVYLPAAIDDVLKQGQAFAESHKYCKKEQAK